METITIYVDGDLKRIYEVPPEPTFTTTPEGYRIYTTLNPSAYTELYCDVKRDLWSRLVDWLYDNQWADLIFTVSGGALRGFDEFGNPRYQSADFTLLSSLGWKMVMANYPHETRFRGNLYSDTGEFFDNARLTSIPSPMPRLEGWSELLTYSLHEGGGGTCPTVDDIAEAVWRYERP